jgi:hypothetical protein
MGFVVLAQLFASTQYVVEEKLCKSQGCPPAQIVGYEGLWGIAMMIVLLVVFYFIPGPDAGSFENAPDSLYMLVHPTMLDAFVLAYLLSIGCYNLLGVTVTWRLSAVHRTIIDALRTAVVIAVDLVMKRCTGRYGADWEPHTYLQLIGFAILVVGATTYHGILRWPFLYYPDAKDPRSSATVSKPQEYSLRGGVLVQQPLIQVEE